MNFFTPTDILLYVSLALLFLNRIMRLIIIRRYYRLNGQNQLTDEQRRKVRRISIPIAITALASAIASIIISVINLAK